MFGATKLEIMRKRENLTQNEAADSLGISRNTLASYESGKNKIPLSVFIRLAELYKCDIFDIFGVHAPNIEYDVGEEELAKAHARYRITAEREKDRTYNGEPFPDEYYEVRYGKCLKETIEYLKIHKDNFTR